MIHFSEKEDRIIQCSHSSKETCPTCEYKDKCRVMGKLDVIMEIEIDRLYKPEVVVFN